MELDNISHKQMILRQPVSTVSEVPAQMESKTLKAGLEVNAREQSTWGLRELTPLWLDFTAEIFRPSPTKKKLN
jgi:hypothetical protein